MRHPTPAGLTAAILMAALAAPAAAAPPTLPEGVTRVGTVEGITEYRLGNGLQILLLSDPSQPKVTVNLTVFVGSRHEGYGETGMAHLLEHMVFKGCPKFPNVPKALRDHGANFNGTTWVDRTNYFETMPAADENLAFGIELEADRMVNSFIKREDLMSEFTVVRNEFERGENDPSNILYQRMLSAAYEWHNYGKSTIGNRTDIERVPIDSLQAFYRKYYRPDNAMLIVAGKFDETKALKLAAENFGAIKNPADPLPKTYTEEPPQDGERVVMLRRVGSVGATGAVYHIPAAAHPDFAACEVLAQVLDDQPNGRLYKALVEAKKASSVNTMAFNTHDPGTLTAMAQTEPDKTEAARDTMIEVLENLKKEPISEAEVKRAKLQLTQHRERTLANSQQFAIGLSNWAGCGDWRLFFLHRDRTENVTAADVNRVADQYLLRSNRTVGVFAPTKAPARADVPETPDLAKLLKGYKGREALAAGEAFDPTPENVAARLQTGKVNGVEYAFLPKKTRGETVNAGLTLRFGSVESLKGKGDAADYVGAMLLRGTKSKSRQEIKDELDRLNAVVHVNSDAGVLTVTAQTKRVNLPDVLTLLREILREPSFPAAEFDLLKQEQLEQLDKARTDPQALAMNALQRTMAPYPPEDPRYVAPYPEGIERVKALTVAQVREVYEQQIGAAAGQLAVVGDFDPEAAKKGFAAALEGWTSATPYKRIPKPTPDPKPGLQVIETPDKANAVYLAALPVAVSDADDAYPALTVGNYVLGAAPLASRLSNRVRGKEGLSYGVGSRVEASAVEPSGQFFIFAITNPKNIDKVNTTVQEELDIFFKEGVTASELDEAKKAYVQAQRGNRASDAALVTLLNRSQYAGRTFRYYAELEKKIDALKPEDVKAAFDKYVNPKNLAVIEAGDLKKK